MLPNSLSPGDGASAAGRPQLRIAARAAQDGRDPSETAEAAVIPTEVQRWHGEWRRTLDAIKDTLADLERTCESAIESREAGIAGVIETIVGSAAAQAEAAAQQTRAQAEIELSALRAEMAALQSKIESLQIDLQGEQESRKRANQQLEAELAARARAEDERDEARREGQRALADAEARIERLRAESEAQQAELAAARQQLEAAIAERSKLAATFQLVQRVLSTGPSVGVALQPEGARPLEARIEQSRPPDVQIDKAPEPAPQTGAAAAAPAAIAPPEDHPEALEDIKQVLEQVKTMYDLDVSSGRSSVELVDSLTSSLRYARDVVVARSSMPKREAEALFDRELDTLLDLKAGTPFGRHLSISAYASRCPQPVAQPESGTA